MKKVIRLVKSYDDVYLRDGKEIEADVEVRISIDGEELSLDLTSGHMLEFRKDLASWLGAACRQPLRAPRKKGTRRRPGDPGLPVERHPTAGMDRVEGNRFLLGLRRWAAAEGRTDEINTKGDKSYTYGQKLVADYRALVEAGESASSAAAV